MGFVEEAAAVLLSTSKMIKNLCKTGISNVVRSTSLILID